MRAALARLCTHLCLPPLQTEHGSPPPQASTSCCWTTSSWSLTTPRTTCGHRGEVRRGRRAAGHQVRQTSPFRGELKPPRLCLDCSSELLPHEEAERLNDVKYLVQQLYTTLRIEEHQLGKERELIGQLEDLNSQLRPLEKVAPNFFCSGRRSFHTASEFALASNLLKSTPTFHTGSTFPWSNNKWLFIFKFLKLSN